MYAVSLSSSVEGGVAFGFWAALQSLAYHGKVLPDFYSNTDLSSSCL